MVNVSFVEALFKFSSVLNALLLVVFGYDDVGEAAGGFGFIKCSDGAVAAESFFGLSDALYNFGCGCFP